MGRGSTIRVVRRLMALRDLPGEEGGNFTQLYRRSLDLPGQGAEEHYVLKAELGTAWSKLQAWLRAGAESKLLFDKRRRTATGWIAAVYPLAMVTVERAGHDYKMTTAVVGGATSSGFDLDDTAHILRPAVIMEDEQYLLDAVTALALRCGWSKGGEPLHEWLDRELLATPVDDTTGVTTRGSTP
jgi:hypothetical protein